MTTSSSGSLAKLLYSDLDEELTTTRRMLERFPSGKDDWRPHGKSMALGRLASHIAELPQNATRVITEDEWDFSKTGHSANVYGTAAKLLEVFDARVRDLRSALTMFDSNAAAAMWTLRDGDHVIFSRAKGETVRHMMINHLVHHRAQLGVYYRMLGVPLPGSYGPSADERV